MSKLLVLLLVIPLLLACNRVGVGSGSSDSGAQPTPDIPASEGGTATSPVPLGTPFVLHRDGRIFQYQVNDVVRDADGMVMAASADNPRPPDGSVYVAVQMRLDYQYGPKDVLYMSTDEDAKLVAGGQEWSDPSEEVPPSPMFRGTNMFAPTTIIGWLPGKYVPADLADDAMLVYRGIYFALK